MAVRQVTFRWAARWKARRPRQRDTKSLFNRITAVSVAVTFAVAPVLAQAGQLPQGGSVAAGSATIGTPHNGTLDINQSSNRAVIDWHSFSVGQGNTVNFNQPSASSATLNRVTGNTPSSIAGTINAPGTVLLVNPNGIAITKDGVINTGSFAASTLDIKNSDFMSGRYKFTGSGNSQAVTNAGNINVSDGGFAALLGGQVANDGVIRARLGKVALGSGELMTLDLAGDGFLSVAIPTKDLGKIKGADGKSLITNSGKIIADGGVVELKAATAAGLLRDAVNVPGSIQANSVGVRNGRIVLGGGAGGRVRIAGRVRARGRHHANGGNVTVTGASVAVSGKISTASKHGKGGTVILTADQVTLGSTAKLDASGATGGTLLIGGDVHGGADPSADFSITPVTNALVTTIAAGATLTANGTNGQGGHIVVWSNDKTTFAGGLSVASANGAGGFAEVSSHKLLDFTGTVDLAGTAGAGTLLLDPENLTIANGWDNGLANGGGTYTAGADNSILSVATLQAALASGNVIVTTGGAGSAGSQAGDITVANDVTWSSGNSLTLDAYRDIDVNANITNTGGAAVTLRADNSGTGTGTVTFGAGNTISTSGTVTIYYNPAGNDATSVNTTSYKTPTDYSGNVAGGGTLASTMLVNTVFDLQNINNNLSANYALGRDIDASGTTSWNSNAGFVPLGTDGAGNVWDGSAFSAYGPQSIGFSGTFDGQSHTISGLTINRPGADFVGLFGFSTGGIENVGVVGGAVAGGNSVGGLVGWHKGGGISNVYATGSVSGISYVGGLIGESLYNTVTNAYATGSVSASYRVAGGLIGSIYYGTLTNAYATGSVIAPDWAGGLVGNFRYGTLTHVHATGPVYGTGLVGGLAGDLIGQLTDGYATGAVTYDINIPAGEFNYAYFGGLVGGVWTNDSYSATAEITNSYATGAVWGGGYGSDVGGLVGGADSMNNLTISASYATGSVYGKAGVGGLVGSIGTRYPGGGITDTYATGSVTGQSNVGGLVGESRVPISSSYATGVVRGSSSVGALLGYNYWGTVSNSYWDTDTNSGLSGIGWDISSLSANVPGVTTADLTSSAVLTALNSGGAIWANQNNQTTPYFSAHPGTVFLAGDSTHLYQIISNVDQLQAINNNLSGNYLLFNDIDASATVTWNSGAGFVPLGTFNGIFNGQNHIISDLTIYRPGSENVGLFSVVDAGATISNVILTDVSVTGRDSVGGLVGYSKGSVSGSSTSGVVTGAALSTAYSTGGLIGYSGYLSTIANSSSSATVSGGNSVGGLVGQMQGTSITGSYASGAVKAAYNNVGGLVGYANINGQKTLTISDSYATGSVTGSNAGGIIGGVDIYGGYQSGLTLTNAWSSGAVTGANAGGVIAQIGIPATYNNVYWDVTASGVANAIGASPGAVSGITGLTGYQAFTQSSYSGFDFTSASPVWYMIDGETRPFLRNEYSTTITNAHQLQLIQLDAAASYTLANNIDASATDGATNPSGMWTASGFVPGGFAGYLDGLGHIVTNLTINRPHWSTVGLFSYVTSPCGNCASIENIGLVGGSIVGYSDVGALMGGGSAGIDDVFTDIAVSGNTFVGGLVGDYSGPGISNVYVAGPVSAVGAGGGVVGRSSSSVVNAYVTGAVSGDYTGRVVGTHSQSELFLQHLLR